MQNKQDSKKKLKFISTGYAWSNAWENGDWYCSGSLGSKKYKIFVQDEDGNTVEAQRFSIIANGFKKEEKHPDWVFQVAVDPDALVTDSAE